MRDLFRNKKTLIPILLGIAIIVIAIVTFIVIGVTGSKKETRVSKVKLDNTQATTNELGNTYDNETKNKTKNEIKNEVDDDDDKDFGVDEFYQKAAKQFIKGFQDEDEIEEFVNEYFDPKAYVAYENAGLDDSRFLEEYNNLDDDDEKIAEVTDNVLAIPSAWEQLSQYIEMFSQMSDDEMFSGMTDDDGNEIDLSDMELSLKLIDIDKPEISEDDKRISKITLKVDFMGQEQEMIMVFFDEVVIYIMDEDGNSFIENVQMMEMDE